MTPDPGVGRVDGRPTDDRAALVRVAVAGRIAPMRIPARSPQVDSRGLATCLPGHGGIAFGVHGGAAVSGYVADHLMVGASVEDADAPPASPGALHLLACLGNVVRDGGGRPIGVVAGKRGGIAPGHFPPNLIAVEAPDARLAELSPGDRVILEAVGRGLALTDWPEIVVANTSPRLLDALPIQVSAGRLIVAVVAIVPARLAGPGLGQDVWVGDVEIAGSTGYAPDTSLRFGDLVAYSDLDGRVSRHYQRGSISIGVVAHGPSPVPGHGIGLTILLSGPGDSLGVVVDPTGSVGSTLRAWGEEVAA